MANAVILGNGILSSELSRLVQGCGFIVYRGRIGSPLPRHWDDDHCSLAVLAADSYSSALSGLCAELRSRTNSPVIVIGRFTSEDDIIKCLESGADEFLTWPQSPRMVTAKIAAVVRRTSRTVKANAAIVRYGEVTLDQVQRCVWVEGRRIQLTSNEFAIVSALLELHGRPVPYSVLISSLQGHYFDEPDSQAVLKVIVRRLRKKMEPDPGNPTFIHNVRGTGYLFDACPSTGTDEPPENNLVAFDTRGRWKPDEPLHKAI